MKYSKRKYRDKSIEVIEEVIAIKKKKIKKQNKKGILSRVKNFFKKIFKR
jgi:hypothetical protein